MTRFLSIALAALFSIAITAQADAKTKHLSLNHTQKHAFHHRHSPTIGTTAIILDVASLAAYPTEMTRGGLRQRPEPMGRRMIAPSNGYSMASEDRVIGGRPSGCPYRYCGCSASLRIFGRIIADLNLASNWRKFPSAAPGPGMAAWRWGHVFIIESVNGDGTVIAHDGNSGGGLTRVHTVSLHGYRVVNPTGSTFSARRINGGQT